MKDFVAVHLGLFFHVHAYIPTYMHAYIPTCACLMQWRAPGPCTHARKNTERLEILHLPETPIPLLNCVLACKNTCSVSQLSIFLMAKSTVLSLSIVFEDSYMKRWLLEFGNEECGQVGKGSESLEIIL